MNAPLTPEETEILKQIVNAASGVGRMIAINLLSAQQRAVLPSLVEKGYVVATSYNCVVVMMPDQ